MKEWPGGSQKIFINHSFTKGLESELIRRNSKTFNTKYTNNPVKMNKVPEQSVSRDMHTTLYMTTCAMFLTFREFHTDIAVRNHLTSDRTAIIK